MLQKNYFTNYRAKTTIKKKEPDFIRIITTFAIIITSIIQTNLSIADTIPVRLKIAYTTFHTVSSYITVYARVKNLAYEKKVTVHYHGLANDDWHDEPLEFTGHYGNYDVFSKSFFGSTREIAIKYNVFGIEYWDNNNGNNYYLNTTFNSECVLGGGKITLNEAKTTTYNPTSGSTHRLSFFEGEIYVNNLSYHKIVGVHWSPDGGQTWRDTNASYSGKLVAYGIPPTPGSTSCQNNIEIWKFKTPEIDASETPFQFAVFYKKRNNNNNDTTATYWDNNFEQNYFLPQTDNAIIK